ncbi:MAG: prenyltransferase [Gammaproteobacteria bacterium]|nr:prenyltransferase [Gammaproteobacteria bacterium]
MSEPTSDIYHCQTGSNVARTCFDAIRPAFLTASILPVLAALAYVLGGSGSLDYLLAILTLISIVCIHAAANVLNDYFDSKNGTDQANQQRVYPFSGGSRFIQNGVLTEEQTFMLGSGLLVVGIVFGLVIAYLSGPVILLIGITGAALAVFYSAPPCLACKGLGDLTIASCFGLLPVIGTVYSQTGAITNSSIWLGLVIGCFVASILWINSIPDIDADKQAGKHTWPARLNKKAASWMHGAWFICGFGMILLTPIGAGYLALLAIVPAAIAVISVVQGNFIPAIPMTLITHSMVCILLGTGFLIG